ncbi:MAG: T9SS type A sorting domain-containing protein [Bacteroidia bacterium]
MKKIILFFILILNIVFANAQVTFYKTIKGYDEAGNYVEQTTDGGYVIAGSSSKSDSASNGYVIKTNGLGDTIWTKVYGRAAKFYSGKQTTDGGYVLLGKMTTDFGNDDIYVLKIDSVGTIQWQKIVDGGLYGKGICVRQTSDGGYIIVGNDYDYIVGYLSFIIKLDPGGNLQWNDILPSNSVINSIEQTTSGGYIATGTISSGTYLMKLNSLGIFQWSKAFGAGGYNYGINIVQANDNGYMILGSTDTTNAMSIIKTDSLGNLILSKSYIGPLGYYGGSIKKANHGNFIIASTITSSFSTMQTKLLLTLVDSAGTELWSRFMGDNLGGTIISGTYAAQATDGGYIFTGNMSDSGPRGFIYFIKTDSIGRTGCNDSLATLITNPYTPVTSIPATSLTSGITISTPLLFNSSRSDSIITYCTSVGIDELKNSSQINVYPNPSSDQFNFSGLEKENKIEVFDLTGQLIYQVIANGDFQKINMDNKAKGIYFYRITKKAALIQQGKIILVK